MKISFLSSLNTNIGDEFIRDGLISVLTSLLPENKWSWNVYNKHQPWTFYPRAHPAQLAGLVDRNFHRGWRKCLNVLSSLPGNQFFDADLVIQSGTPIIWNGAHRSEWAIPFWKNFAQKNQGKIPLLNLAGGSCYAWSSPPSQLQGKDRDFAATMVDACSVTTTRDPLAAQLLSEASGKEIPLLPCSAFLAGQHHANVKKPDGRILFNVMPIGGHFDYLKQIDPSVWLNTVMETLQNLPGDCRAEFICHSRSELDFAQKHWSAFPIHMPENPRAYFRCCEGATAAVVNRLHAAVGLSGLGIPSIAIGTDTRLLMTREIGIPSLFAPEVTTESLIGELRGLLAERETRSQILQQKRTVLFKSYQDILRPYMELFIQDAE